MTTFRKETVLKGVFATGDHECFCFDTHRSPREHDLATGKWDDKEEEEEYGFDKCRTYPGQLLPPESKGKKGTFKIVVEFEEDP